jgi:hypothetical protein
MHLRELTGDDRFVAEVEIRADPFRTRLLHALYRPFILTAHEPIVLLFALYREYLLKKIMWLH